MADREKVIKEFELFIKDFHPACTSEGVELDMFREALALLKEQKEPKPIVRKQCKKEYEDGSIDYFSEWYCPHCGKLLNRGFDTPWIEFCYKCGKPVLWGGR